MNIQWTDRNRRRFAAAVFCRIARLLLKARAYSLTNHVINHDDYYKARILWALDSTGNPPAGSMSLLQLTRVLANGCALQIINEFPDQKNN